VLYAVNEICNGPSVVVAFSIDQKTGALKEINKRSTHGASACHLITDNEGKFLYIANYEDGKVSVFPINDDGSIGELRQLITHSGSGPNESRQKGPHCHQVLFDKNNKYAFVCDLGTDEVVGYTANHVTGELTALPNSVKTRAGGGPRHVVFHPSYKFAYILNELSSTIQNCSYDQESGVLTPMGEISTLPQEARSKTSNAAAIRILPNGKFLYSSNRGHDSIAIFSVNDDGGLTNVDYHPSGGVAPRDFNIDPTGTVMLIGNQDTDTVKLCTIDNASGKLVDQSIINVSTPVAIHFVNF